jgi:hypothetical protein
MAAARFFVKPSISREEPTMDIEQRLMDQPAYATATVTPGASTVSLVTITVRNANGAPRGPTNFDVLLSDAANGQGLTAVTASGNVGTQTAGTTGTDLQSYVAKKALYVQNLANGTYVLSITDAAKTAFKVCAVVEGMTIVVATLATASYGP